MDPVPSGSIYLWMYTQGLKKVNGGELNRAIQKSGHTIRQKDADNYGRGWYKSDLYNNPDRKISILSPPEFEVYKPNTTNGDDFPTHPYLDQPNPTNRYIPCNSDGRPLIKWSKGCLSLDEAQAYYGCKYIGENIKGVKYIIVDVDGDHTDSGRVAAQVFNEYRDKTHALVKPIDDDQPLSYHLTFTTTKVISTMHFPDSNIDIIGNEKNSIRYFKNKEGNGIEPIMLTKFIGEDILSKIDYIKEVNNGISEQSN